MLEYMKIYSDMEQLFEPFTQEEKGNLLDAMMGYCFRGEAPTFSGNERFIWPVLRRHIDQCAEKSETLRANAAKGGRPKKQKEPDETKAEQIETYEKETETKRNQTKPNETKLNPIQEQEHIQEQEQKQKGRTRAVDSKFEIFWKAYPRKVGKGFAQRSFEKIKPDETLFTTMLNAISKAKTSAQWTKDNGQYIPNPATWLNQRRWEDEPTQAAPQPSDYQRRQYGDDYWQSIEQTFDDAM